MVRRIAEEVDGYSIELGTDSRLVRLQLEEMLAGVEEERRQILRDYLPAGARLGGGRRPGRASSQLTTERLLDLSRVASVCASAADRADLEGPCGRTVTGCCRRSRACPTSVVRNIVDRYGGLQQILRASVEDLDTVEGIEVAGRTLREGGPRPSRRNEHPGPAWAERSAGRPWLAGA